jgi:hypothetical protein
MIKVDNLTDTAQVDVVTLLGVPEKVTIRRLSVRELKQALRHIEAGETEQVVAMSTGRTVEWLDTLIDDSIADLTKSANELVFQRASILARGDVIVAKLLLPLATEFAALAEKAKSHGLPLSPVPAPSASAEATGSASSTSAPSESAA